MSKLRQKILRKMKVLAEEVESVEDLETDAGGC